MKNPYRIGQKIYLRPLERDDAPVLTEWVNDPDVTRTLEIHRPMSLSAEESFIDRLQKNPEDIVLGIVLREDDRMIGVCGLHQVDNRNRHAFFGILIGDKAEWNKGYGTEATRLITGVAFDTLNLNRVWLMVYDYNPGGIKAYENVGYRQEGTLRKHHFHDGRYHDTLVMGILREEWEARRDNPAR